MPWRSADAAKFTKLANTPRLKRLWRDVANRTLARCLARGGRQSDCEGGAIQAANSVIKRRHEEMKKNLSEQKKIKKIGGTEYPASSFLVVEDPESPSTWHLPVKDPDGTPNHRLMGAAWAALHGGYRGRKYSGPEKEDAIRKLRAIYKTEDMETPSTEVSTPEGLDDLDSLIFEEETAAEIGRRLQTKQLASLRAAIEKIDAFLKWAEYGDGKDDDEDDDEENAGEVMSPIMSMVSGIMSAFYEQCGQMGKYWPVDIVVSHPALGNCVIAKDSKMGVYYAVPFVGGDGSEISFAPMEDWIKVVATYLPIEGEPEPEPEPVSAGGENNQDPAVQDSDPAGETDPEGEPELAETQVGESSAGAVEIETIEEAEGDPLKMSVILIRPGFGNSRDNHYYPAEMLRRDAHIFEGSKMYETDHRSSEKSTRTWVSTVNKIAGFTDDGAPIGEVIVHNNDFADRVKNLQRAGLIEKMECSILAVGRARKGEAEGKKANVVEELTQAISVDWVTQAGAGGKAIGIAETDAATGGDPPAVIDETTNPEPLKEGNEGEDHPTELEGAETDPANTEPQENEPEPVYLSEGEVLGIVEKHRGLTLPIRRRIAEAGPFETAEQVEQIVSQEIEYLKAVTGSGKPFGQPVNSQTTGKPGMSKEEYEERMAAILEKYQR